MIRTEQKNIVESHKVAPVLRSRLSLLPEIAVSRTELSDCEWDLFDITIGLARCFNDIITVLVYRTYELWHAKMSARRRKSNKGGEEEKQEKSEQEQEKQQHQQQDCTVSVRLFLRLNKTSSSTAFTGS